MLVDRKVIASVGAFDVLGSDCGLTATRLLNAAKPGADLTYVASGYVEPGYVGGDTGYKVEVGYVASGYVEPGYVSREPSAAITATRLWFADAGQIMITDHDAALVVGGTLLLSEQAINAIADAIWARPIPITGQAATEFGTHNLYTGDLDAIAYAVWSKQL